MIGLGLSIPEVAARGGGGAAFSPADLFASGEAGAWYDPSDLSTLWQDTGGTVQVTADGQSVARIDDLSGNGNHVTQGTAGLRPVYKTSGGKHWLLGDGVDDILVRGAASFADLAQPGTMAVAARYNSVAAGATHIIDAEKSGGTGRWTIYRNGTDARVFAGTEVTFGVADTADHVYLTEFNGASSFVRYDGTESVVNPGAEPITAMSLFAAVSTVGHMAGRIYAAVVTSDQLTADEISGLETYLNGKTP